MTKRTLAAWTLRLLLAILLFFGSEVLLWTHFLQYTWLDWLLRIVGYSVLSIFVLDLAVRFRIRDIYDAMVVFAMYGVLASLLITPTISYEGFPRSFLTRVMGGHTLLGFEVWGLFLVLIAGKNRRYRLLLLGASAWVGFYWGIWMRWIPEFGTLFEAVSLQTMFTSVAAFLAVVMIIYVIMTQFNSDLESRDLQLQNPQWWLLFIVMLAFFLYQFYIVDISIVPVVITALVLLVCWSIIWYRRENQDDTLLDSYLPIKRLSFLWIILAIAVFVVATLFSYHLPLVGTREINQLWLMELGFAAVGALWLPIVASVLAMRGLDHQMRTNQLQ
ncbi:MAG: hypothetical protein Q9P01_11960 [Anaerolineae bacterium]|nr:hypothetical protein [Anaerolineae bacterium]MDQ7035514.1 hypothetical protein [Anaerolineae bacterium]